MSQNKESQGKSFCLQPALTPFSEVHGFICKETKLELWRGHKNIWVGFIIVIKFLLSCFRNMIMKKKFKHKTHIVPSLINKLSIESVKKSKNETRLPAIKAWLHETKQKH